MRFVKPLDVGLLQRLARTHETLVTVEEGCITGGAGSACLECLSAAGIAVNSLLLGFSDNFVEHGEPAELLATCGLDADGIENAIVSFVTPPVAKFVADVGSFTDESEAFVRENTRIYRGERP